MGIPAEHCGCSAWAVLDLCHHTGTFLGSKGIPVMLGTMLELKEITWIAPTAEGGSKGWRGWPWAPAGISPGQLVQPQQGARDKDTLLV